MSNKNNCNNFYMIQSKINNNTYLVSSSNQDTAYLTFYNNVLSQKYNIDSRFDLISDEAKIYVCEELFEIFKASANELIDRFSADYVMCLTETNEVFCVSESDDIDILSDEINDTLYCLNDKVCIFNTCYSKNDYECNKETENEREYI